MKLECHPISPPIGIHGLQASAELHDDTLHTRYILNGNIAKIHLPESKRAQFRHGLWKHTCFELFVASESATAYQEYNLSPSGEWAAYRFSKYRKPEQDLLIENPQIKIHSGPNILTVHATLSVETLPAAKPWNIGLSAVIETESGLSWWALAHTGKQPDFHSRDTFRMLLS